MRQLTPGSPLFFVAFPKRMKRMFLYQTCIGFLFIYFIYRLGFFGWLSKFSLLSRGTQSDILSYFPDANQDGSLVIWEHAVNDKQSLKKAIESECHMIEADILMGNVDSHSELFPIMAHPPATSSDLTLSLWAHAISETKKGIKLDFKQNSAVEAGLKQLAPLSGRIKGPVVINADILAGPNMKDGGRQLDPNSFITAWKKHYPDSLLSVGWTTNDGPEGYTWEHVTAMYNALYEAELFKKGSNPVRVTFPVRASLCHSGSFNPLRWLLDIIPQSSLTFWGNRHDRRHSGKDVLRFRNILPFDRLFLDLHSAFPKAALEEYHKLKSSPEQLMQMFYSDERYMQVLKDIWDVVDYRLQAGIDTLLMGKTSLVFKGRDFMMISRQTRKATITENTKVSLTVHAWGEIVSCAIQVVMRGLKVSFDEPDGIISVIHIPVGTMAIQMNNKDRAMQVEERFDNFRIEQNTAVSLEVTDDGTRIVFVVRTLDNYAASDSSTKDSKRLVLATPLNSQEETVSTIMVKCNSHATYVAAHDISLDYILVRH